LVVGLKDRGDLHVSCSAPSFHASLITEICNTRKDYLQKSVTLLWLATKMAPERIDLLLAQVQEWCAANGVNQLELAKRLGVRPSHITEWKKGRSRPNGETTLAMLELIQNKPKAPRKRRAQNKL
jgi:DNA-binding transcriptional regulator YiaG